MLNKADFEKLDERLKNITMQPVEQIAIDTDVPPTIEDMEDNNKTYVIQSAILFIDIRKSTYLTENSQAKSMVKIYRAFMRMAVECIRKNAGVTRQFLGDRIMGVFIDSVDENGNVTDKAVDKAINCARSLQTAIDFSLNKYLKNNVNGKIIECGIGIDYGKVLVTKVGMYGVESDETKENEMDCVWVGNATNHASKYSDLASGGEIFISDSVYKALSDELKQEDVWKKSAKYKGTKLFSGYVAQDYYLDYAEELGNPVKVESDNTVQQDTSYQLADGIQKIEELQNKLIQRERELAVLEEKLKKENSEYQQKYEIKNAEKEKAIGERNQARKNYHDILDLSYGAVKDVIEGSFWRNYEYIEQIGEKRWESIEIVYQLLAKLKGDDEVSLMAKAFKFIEVFAYFKQYDKAYQYMVAMAKGNHTWIYINEATFKWACEQNKGWKVISAMEDNLKNNRVAYAKQEDYKEYIERLKKIRGF